MRIPALLTLVALGACRMPSGIPIVSPTPEPVFPAGFTVIDLTRPLDRSAPYLPHAEAYPFERLEFKGPRQSGWRTGGFSALEHMGTHVAAPLARLPGGAAMDTIGASSLILPLVVVDAPRSGLFTAADVVSDEASRGAIPAGCVVVLRTGRGTLRSEDAAYLGKLPDGSFDFPGWSEDAVRLLARERRVVAMGTDAIAVDAGANVAAAPAQSAGSIAGLWFVAGLADLSKVPARGATLVVGALPVAGGAGSPARVLALVPVAR